MLLVILAFIAIMIYLVKTNPVNRNKLMLITSLAAVVILYLLNKQTWVGAAAKWSWFQHPKTPKHVAAVGTDGTTEAAASEAITDALTAVNLPQVDVIGRNIDDKMAMNKTASRVVIPGGVNAVFETNVAADPQVGVPQPSEGTLLGSPLF